MEAAGSWGVVRGGETIDVIDEGQFIIDGGVVGTVHGGQVVLRSGMITNVNGGQVVLHEGAEIININGGEVISADGTQIYPMQAQEPGQESVEVQPVSGRQEEEGSSEVGPREIGWADLPPDIKALFAGMLESTDQAAFTQTDRATHAAIGCAGAPGVQGVHTQQELDVLLANPGNTTVIHLLAGKGDAFILRSVPGGVQVHAHDLVHVTVTGNGRLYAFGSAQVTTSSSNWVFAYDSAQVIATGEARVNAKDQAHITATDRAWIVANDSTQVTASGNASVDAYDSAHVIASGNARVSAHDSTRVYADGRVSVRASGNAIVTASGSVTVVIRAGSDMVQVVASDPTVTIARER